MFGTLVVGGSRGVGLEAVRILTANRESVQVLSRRKNLNLGGQASQAKIVHGDITQAESLQGLGRDVSVVLYTAGKTGGVLGTGFLSQGRDIRSVEYDGLVNVLTALRESGFAGRFVYLTAMGLREKSLLKSILEVAKPGLVLAKLQAEAAVESCGLDYTIVRAGRLTSSTEVRDVVLDRLDSKLTWDKSISRTDVAKTMIHLADQSEWEGRSVSVYWGAKAQEIGQRVNFGTSRLSVSGIVGQQESNHTSTEVEI